MANGPCGPLLHWLGLVWLFGSFPLLFINGILCFINKDPPSAILIVVFTWIFVVPFLSALAGHFQFDVYRSFPFVHFWRHITIQSPRLGWTEVDKLEPASRDDGFAWSQVCDKCAAFTAKSSILHGSFWLFICRVEWYPSHATLGQLERVSQTSCQMCSVFWHSIPTAKRSQLLADEADDRPLSQTAVTKTPHGWSSWFTGFISRRKKSLKIRCVGLRIKAWEELHGDQYEDHEQFVQLYRGNVALCKGIPIKKSNNISLNTQSSIVAASTGSDHCMSLAKYWLQECAESKDHTACRPARSTTPSLPKRLVYVGEKDQSSQIHLHITSPEDGHTDYLALSHCWGRADFLKLTLANYNEMLREIDYRKLPQNFQDAIVFTRRMGFSYLWIDSLCIIQGSLEDWKAESNAMSRIYSQAFCTISATGSPDANGGCFRERNPTQYEPCVLISSPTENLSVQLGSPNPFISQIENGTLSQRAWAFQERLLSRRIVHFGSSLLFFECRTHFTSELMQTAITEGSHIMSIDGLRYDVQDLGDRFSMSNRHITKYEKLPNRARKRRIQESNPKYRPVHVRDSFFQSPALSNRGAFNFLQRATRTPDSTLDAILKLHQCWYQLVEAYTGAQLTLSSDRTVAVNGIAQAIGEGKEDLQYWAGLWSDHLHFDLLWCLDSPSASRPTQSRAPTWSWMAVEGRICQRLAPFQIAYDGIRHTIEYVAKICDISAEPVSVHSRDTSGVAYEGHLDIEGVVMPVTEVTVWSLQRAKYLVKMNSIEGILSADFFPDTQHSVSDKDLLCIEVLRIGIGATWDLGGYGLVLRKRQCPPAPTQQDDRYERVGMFKLNHRRTNTVTDSRGYGTISGTTRRRIRIV
ncbi:hypothetical protein FZEAL_7978 [Fusarium zealandicum]|uniref:Heterokaryon incompatibility domain-containing protein n=1 Tax=Fusarium zealandicum TaxID=1053134 RepID=A0A8H4XHY6_9HYPO|nr:hypothetical protein FZEAL_7978 [Fusarium zealandicum]